MKGNAIAAQVFIYNNLDALDLPPGVGINS